MRYSGKGHPYTDCTKAIEKGKGKAVEKSDGKTFYGYSYRSAPYGTMVDWKN